MKNAPRRSVRNLSPKHKLVESLESRTFLSVSATVVNGTLVVHGDAARNAITLDQTGLSAQQVRVTGASGTKVNAKTVPVILNGVTRGVVVQMGNAADDVTLRDLHTKGNVAVDSRGGANTLVVDNVRVDASLNIANGAQRSTTAIGTTTVGQDLTVRGGPGAHNVSILSSHVKRNTVIDGGTKSALVTIDDSVFNGIVRVTTGAAADVVRIDSLGAPLGPSSRFTAPVVISLGAGRDTLQLGVTGQSGNHSTFASAVHFSGGPGFDTLQNLGASTYKAKPKSRVVDGFESKITTFETVAPTVSSVNPAPGATGIARNQQIAVAFSEPMNPSTLTTANVALTAAGVQVAGTVSYVGTTMTFSPTATLAANTPFTLTVTTAAMDLAGNPLASNFTSTFTTGATADTTAPTVTSTDPTSAQTAVPVNKKLAVTFSEPMDPPTISASNVTLTGPDGSAVSGSVAYVGNTMTFTPASALSSNTAYSLTVTTGAKDLAGNSLSASVVCTFTTGSTSDTTAPAVTSTSPSALQTNVAINKTVAATFTESMDVTTITTATFRLTDSANAPVSGTAGYDVASKTATFKSLSNLAPNTTYTATITGGASGVKDLAGNSLLLDKSWSFTTGAQTAQAPINLGAASPFAVMATASINSTGATVINGDVGLNPGSAQGIPPAQVNGTIHVTDQAIIDAQSDLLAAYNDAVGRTSTSVSLPGNMGGLTFTPGLYTNSTSVLIQGSGPANNVTLDAQGDPNAIFIFQMGSTLTTGPGAQVILAGGAKASNIFWQVGTSATLDTTTIFKGNVIAAVTITVNNGSAIEGRLLAGSNSNGSVTINASSVTVPAA